LFKKKKKKKPPLDRNEGEAAEGNNEGRLTHSQGIVQVVMSFNVAGSLCLCQDLLHVSIGQPGWPIRLARSADRIGGHKLTRIGREGDDVEGPVHDERISPLPRIHIGPHVALPLVRPIVVIVPVVGSPSSPIPWFPPPPPRRRIRSRCPCNGSRRATAAATPCERPAGEEVIGVAWRQRWGHGCCWASRPLRATRCCTPTAGSGST